MPDYNNSRFPRKPFNKGGYDRGAPKQMYKAECSNCHKTCEVPFRPNGKKPVFCSDCFVKDDQDGPRERREFSPRPSFDRAPAPRRDNPMPDIEGMKYELKGINEKLERLIRIMEAAPAPAQEEKKPAKKAVAKKKK